MRALIMAGGEGKRLHPLTKNLPKPLLEVAGKPILEHALLSLKRSGVFYVTLAVAHLAHMIEERLGDGSQLGMRVSYLHEDRPLGTGGALTLLPDFNEPVVLMNGDVLTDLDFRLLWERHRAKNAWLTVATKVRPTALSLGVLDVNDDAYVTAYREKPVLEHRFGIGMYVVDPAARDYLEPNTRQDMPDLVNRLIAAGHPVAAFEHRGHWVDIGTPEEYERVRNGHPMDLSGAAAATASGS